MSRTAKNEGMGENRMMQQRIFKGATIIMAMLIAAAISSTALADKRKRKKRRASGKVPTSAHIQEVMGDVQWGWSEKKFFNYQRKLIMDAYRPRLAKETDPIVIDELRHQRDRDIAKLRESYVKFDGDVSGYDSSFLKGHFTHNNGESMFVLRTDSSEDYYFFINGKLWKLFRSFNAKVFHGADYDQFSKAIQKQFGKGKAKHDEIEGGKRRYLVWKNKTTRARAVDFSSVYSMYAIVLDSHKTVAKLADLRQNTAKKKKKGDEHKIVDSVIEKGSAKNGKKKKADDDGHADVVDRITGKIRRRPKKAAKK